MKGFGTDVTALGSAAGLFPDLVDRAVAVHRDLSDALADAGDCWGDDAVGESFASGHHEPATAALNAFAALGGRLTDTGGAFGDSATGYGSAEDSAVWTAVGATRDLRTDG